MLSLQAFVDPVLFWLNKKIEMNKKKKKVLNAAKLSQIIPSCLDPFLFMYIAFSAHALIRIIVFQICYVLLYLTSVVLLQLFYFILLVCGQSRTALTC